VSGATSIRVENAQFGPDCRRALFREHKVSSELWAKMVETFGRQRTVEIIALIGDYFTVGMMMNAVEQHLPPPRQALLPLLTG
jgi:hypothetical protein